MTEWIDISVGLREGMVHWPGNPPFLIERVTDMSRGDSANVSKLSMGSHTGTHVDAPVHFIPGGKSLDEIPVEAMIGPARIIEIANKEKITQEELEGCKIQGDERILFRTVNSLRAWNSDTFVEDFVFISKEAASYLASLRVRTVGVDYLSVGGFKSDAVETHRALLGAGVCIIEGLDLSRVIAGSYELICLPIKVVGGDGAPARVLVRRLG
ncbi:MAG TPA: cyclase family protein [Nitrososphaerales archaeon]|nr:cyclase family protein [Nitrososphaerales archaeon]